jgi:hypothetical protein
MKHYPHIIPAVIFLASIFGCAAKDPKISTNFPYCAPACVWYNNDNETIDPLIYRDVKSGVFFYVESDGRHISAFTSGGVLLWIRNPFEDAHLWPYRVSKPMIASIQDLPESNRLLIRYNSSQSGTIEKATGDFTFGGQD